MVPISKKGFMPGKLIHTNEVLVLLGDNWMIERSAKQSGEMIDRRLAGIEEHIKNLNEEKNKFVEAIKWTDSIIQVAIKINSIYFLFFNRVSFVDL